MRFRFLLSRLSRGLWASLICAALVAGATNFDLMDRAEGALLDRLFRARGVRSPDPRVTIVVADDAAVARVGEWPLPRHIYADVITRLTRAGARTIALDVLLSNHSPSSSDDAALVRACRQSGRVVQATALNIPLIYNPVIPVTLMSDRRPISPQFAVKDEGVNCRSASWASSALPELVAAAPAVGHLNIHPELDGTLRRIPHVIRYRDRLYPSLSLAASAHFLGLKTQEVVAKDDTVSLPTPGGSPRIVPLDQNGEAWINWAGGNDTFPTYSFNQLLDGDVPPEALKDHLVLIGVTAAGTFEYRATPFSPVQPAVELQANAISDILRDRPLHQAPLALGLLVLVLASTMTGVLVMPRRALEGTLYLGLILCALWYGGVAALSQGLYIPLFAPMVSSVLTYIVVIAMSYRREWENNWRADASVSALARGGALMASGRQREGLIDVIHQTAREVLGAADVFLVLQHPEGGVVSHPLATQLPALGPATQQILDNGAVVLWTPTVPTPSKKSRIRSVSKKTHQEFDLAVISTISNASDDGLGGVLKQLLSQAKALHKSQHDSPRHSLSSIVAAPLQGSHSNDGISDGEASSPRVQGVLLALGRSDGQPFTVRDATLLQTLTEQASLALDNLGYYELLQGRVELANRNLRSAYDVLSEERAQLSQERTKLAAAVESMESALIISDEGHRAVFENGMSASVLSGMKPVLGQSMPEVLLSHDWRDLAALFARIEEFPGEKAVLETTRIVDRGPDLPPERSILAAQLTPLLTADGLLGSMLVVSDVTAERELEQMKSDFVSFVAHELRTPLTSINGFAALMKLSTLKFSETERAEMLSSIEGQCVRLSRLISDLLEVARLEPGHGIDLRIHEVDAVALCRKVIGQLRVLISDPDKLTLRMRCDAQQLWLGADSDRLEQVLINLISNAIKYSPDGGTVTLDVRGEGEKVIVAISDTGMGMTPEQLAQLFQKFYRTGDAQTRGIQGTGLGLYLVKQLVEAHQGQIEVSSVQNEGTTFTVTLPTTLAESEI